MTIKFNCTGTERKKLVQAISEITGLSSEYQYMPTCAYNIGTMTVDKEGTLHCEDGTDIDGLLQELRKRGFITETENDAKNAIEYLKQNRCVIPITQRFILSNHYTY